jgi:hypothetical protein
MATLKNLFFSLPDELMRKIYHYDNTYKEFFDNYPLKLHLREKLFDMNYYTTDISHCVLETLDDLLDEDHQHEWSNEFLSISPNSYNVRFIENMVNDTRMVFFVNGPFTFFKVVPNDCVSSKTELLTHVQYYDGFICDSVENMRLANTPYLHDHITEMMRQHHPNPTQIYIPSYVAFEPLDVLYSRQLYIWFGY